MNILIYIPDLDQSQGGIRQYSTGLIGIIAQDLSNRYFIYHNCSDPEVKKLFDRYDHLLLVQDADVAINSLQRRVIRGKGIVNSISQRIIRTPRFEILSVIDRIINKYKIDIIHCPYQFIPITKKAKLIVTLHDVQEIHFPEFFTAEERSYRASGYLDYLRRADKVVVSYSHIKNDLIKYFSVPSVNIDVILLDMGKLWFEKFSGKDLVSLDYLDLPEKFIFYPANTWIHKNHIRILQAIALLRDKYGCAVNLVCSGHLSKYYDDVLCYEMEKLGLHNQVRFLGVVDERVLYNLYKQCLGVVVPTIYEAGSFPLMESILLKVPVICSNVTSLPDTIGNLDFVFDPYDIEDMADKINKLWTLDKFREQSITDSNNSELKLRQTGALDKFISLYRELYSQEN